MRAAEANRIESDHRQCPDDLECAIAYLKTPDHHIAPVSKDICLGFIVGKPVLHGTPAEIIAQFEAQGIPVIFRYNHIYYDTLEEIPWN